jgi:PAS domain S-box-containing protein
MPDNISLPSCQDILVVDDNPNNIRFLSQILTEQGYRVRKAINGELALNAVHFSPPDLILLDIMMPDMDGYELCQKIKSNPTYRSIPIIFISALSGDLDKNKAFKVGGNDYITKPIQIQEVLSKINIQLSLLNLQHLLTQEAQARQQAEYNYRSIFEHAIDGMFQTTAAGQFIKANLALARLYGYDSPEELMATITNINENFYVRPQRRDEFLAYMEIYDFVEEFESEIYCKNGDIIWISESVRQVKNDKQELLYFEGTVRDVTEKRQIEDELRKQRRMSEELLLNILPQYIAEKLKRNRHTIADYLPEVTVLFADLVGFTELSAKINPTELVTLLNEIFSEFDQLTNDYGLEKIKTIGDAYMVVGGLPVYQNIQHRKSVERVAQLALDMQKVIKKFNRPRVLEKFLETDDDQPFELRIGINTGAVVAGVIGVSKLQLDLWGDTVNIASRMESQGLPGKIQVTEATYDQLKDKFILEKRGIFNVRGRGKMTTYWLIGECES